MFFPQLCSCYCTSFRFSIWHAVLYFALLISITRCIMSSKTENYFIYIYIFISSVKICSELKIDCNRNTPFF